MADRPSRHSQEIVQAACQSILPEIVEWNDGQEPCSFDALVRAADDNGFEFARNLADYISPDAELVEILESFSSHTWAAHDAAQKAWVQDDNIVVPFVAGQRGRVARSSACKALAGYISEIKPESAELLFVPDTECERFAKGGGWVVAVEDFQPDVEGGAA